MVHGEVELDVLSPDAWADLDIAEAAFLVELALRRLFTSFAGVYPSAGDLPPDALLGSHGVAALNQEHAPLVVEQDGASGWPAKFNGHAATSPDP